MCIKAVLQIRLVNFYGQSLGLVLYKIILALIMNSILSHELVNCLDSDLKSQAIKKLSRRIYKLNSLNSHEQCQSIVNSTIYECSVTIKKLKIVMQLELDSILNNSTMTQIDPSKINIKRDFYHHIPEFKQKINYLKFLKYSRENFPNVELDIWKRNKSTSIFPRISFLKLYENENYDSVMQLYEIECWVFAQKLNLKLGEKFDSSRIFSILDNYYQTAQSFYDNDELGNSRMILASLKMVCLLDKLACEEFNLLSEHKFGVNTDCLKNLLLISVKEIDCALQVKVRGNLTE